MNCRIIALFIPAFGCAAAFVALPRVAHGQTPPMKRLVEWESATVAYLYGFNWRGATKQRDVLTLEYANRWKFGDHFAFLDLANLTTHRSRGGTNVTAGGTTVYAEWQARFSPGRILMGRSLGFGPIRDVLTAHELNVGPNLLAHLHGLGLVWAAAPGVTVKTNVYWRDNLDQKGSTVQGTLAIIAPLSLGDVGFLIHGFVDYAGREEAAPRQIISNTQFLVDAGALFSGMKRQLYAGVELAYLTSWSSTGTRMLTVPQAMIKWAF